MTRAFSACLVLLVACTGKTPPGEAAGDEVPAPRGAGPAAVEAPAAAPTAPAPPTLPTPSGPPAPTAADDLVLGPWCTKFVELVKTDCPAGSEVRRRVQAGHRLGELAALKTDKDRTGDKYEKLCHAEIETFGLLREQAGAK